MALVILRVAFTEAMRLRMSFREAMDALAIWNERRRRLRSEKTSGELLGHLLNYALELGGGSVGQVLAVADVVEDAGVLAPEIQQESLLEGLDLVERHRIAIAVDAGVDHADLLFHL